LRKFDHEPVGIEIAIGHPAGFVDGGVVVARMLSGKGHEGFDASRKEYVNLMEAGIIDPTKVVRVALENAVSVASILLLTEATMTEIPEDKKERMAEPEMAL
jgi:chaperonin GroEL